MPAIVTVLPGESVHISPTASGFAHGFGLFETMRFADGQLYFWEAHWARLTRSADHFGLPLPEESAVLQKLGDYVRNTSLDNATLKLSLMKTSDGSCLYVYSRPSMELPESRRLLFDSRYPLPSTGLLAGHKTHNYMESIHLLGEARSAGYLDYLRMNADGFVAETTIANFFMLEGEDIITAPLSTGLLPGVIRSVLLDLPEFSITETTFVPDRLADASAAFLTNASAGILKVDAIDGLPNGRSVEFETESPVLSRVQEAFAKNQTEKARQLI